REGRSPEGAVLRPAGRQRRSPEVGRQQDHQAADHRRSRGEEVVTISTRSSAGGAGLTPLRPSLPWGPTRMDLGLPVAIFPQAVLDGPILGFRSAPTRLGYPVQHA